MVSVEGRGFSMAGYIVGHHIAVIVETATMFDGEELVAAIEQFLKKEYDWCWQRRRASGVEGMVEEVERGK